jgi:hypothetical protein
MLVNIFIVRPRLKNSTSEVEVAIFSLLCEESSDSKDCSEAE